MKYREFWIDYKNRAFESLDNVNEDSRAFELLKVIDIGAYFQAKNELELLKADYKSNLVSQLINERANDDRNWNELVWAFREAVKIINYWQEYETVSTKQTNHLDKIREIYKEIGE